MKLGKITIKDGQTWFVIHGQMQEHRTVHLNCEVESIEEKGSTIVVKVKK